jgi:hypothetical protein
MFIGEFYLTKINKSKHMKLIAVTILYSFSFIFCQAQDAEFPRGEFIMHMRLHNGMVTNFKGTAPDVYVGGLQIIPQYTLVQNKLRSGIIAGAFFTNKKINALIGPTISYKIKTFNAGIFGSGGNVHLSAEHLWGTQKQRLFGGGIHLDLANKLVISFMLHRDYNLNNWWLQNGIAFRISKVKQPKPI